MFVTRFCLALLLLFTLVKTVNADLVFSAPPRETPEVGKKIYGPVADYLSQVLGQKVHYQHPGSWGIYQGAMQRGRYDIIFDGPHLVSWRLNKKGHHTLVKLPGKLVFVVVVKRNNKRYTGVAQLRGRRVCALAPPNLATLTLLKQFGPNRQPFLKSVTGFKQGYLDMLSGKCDAAVLRDVGYARLSKKYPGGRIIFRSKPVPNQAFTVGQKISPAMRGKITQALLSAKSKNAIDTFRKRYVKKGELTAASDKEYAGMYAFLKDTWGFGI